MAGDQFYSSVRRRAPLIAISAILVAIVAGFVARSAPPQYVSATSLLVGPVSSDVDTLRASQALTATYSQLLLQPRALQQVAAAAQVSPSLVFASSDVGFNTETRIITLTVTTSSSRLSRELAGALTRQLTTLIGTIDPAAPGSAQILSAQPQTAVAVTRSAARYALLAAAGWVLLSLSLLAAFAATRPASDPEPKMPAVTPLSLAPAEPAQVSAENAELIADRVAQKLIDAFVDDGPNLAQG